MQASSKYVEQLECRKSLKIKTEKNSNKPTPEKRKKASIIIIIRFQPQMYAFLC